MSNEGEPVKVEGGHVSVTTISMSGPETSKGKSDWQYKNSIIKQFINFEVEFIWVT